VRGKRGERERGSGGEGTGEAEGTGDGQGTGEGEGGWAQNHMRDRGHEDTGTRGHEEEAKEAAPEQQRAVRESEIDESTKHNVSGVRSTVSRTPHLVARAALTAPTFPIPIQGFTQLSIITATTSVMTPRPWYAGSRT
jgi:hypothetical protein